MNIGQRLNTLYNNWIQLSWWGYLFIAFLLSIILSLAIAAFFEFAGITTDEVGSPNFVNDGIVVQLFAGIVFAPLFETWLYQHLPIVIIQHVSKRRNYYMCLLATSLVFAAGHAGYSIWYGIIVFPLGLLLAETYLVFQQRKESANWITVALHALRNLLAFAVHNFT